MTYADFGTWSFFAYLVGCFTAFALSLRSDPSNRVLAFIYGAWITAAFAAHHILVPHAAEKWHHWWYVWNMFVAAFPILPAYMLKDAKARKPVIIFGSVATGVCFVYAFFSALGHPLPGLYYFYAASLCEASQVVSLVIWSGPVVPLFMKARKFITGWRTWPWTHHRLSQRV